MSRARLSLVGSVLAVGAALAAGHARTGGGVAEADVRRAGIAAPVDMETLLSMAEQAHRDFRTIVRAAVPVMARLTA